MSAFNVSTKVRRIALPGVRTLHTTSARFRAQVAIEQTDNASAVRPFSEVPRPGKLRFLREFLPSGKYHNSSLFDTALTMRKHYGDIFIMPGLFGRKDFVMVFNTKDIEQVFRNEGVWPKREGFSSLTYFREKLRPDVYDGMTGLVVAQDEQWGQFRSVVNSVFMQPKGLKMYYEPLSNINDEFIERIKEIRDPHTLEVPNDFYEELSRLIFESLAYIAFDREMGVIRKNRDNRDAIIMYTTTRESFQLSYKLDMEPSLWKIIPTPNFRRMERCLNENVETAQRIMAESRLQADKKRALGQSSNSLMERLVNINPKVALIMGLEILFAGIDASTTFLAALLVCLSKNPEKQQNLREEVMRIMPTKDTPLDEERMKDMPYLRAFIKETLRYYPNVLGTLRECPTDNILSGYHIPAGSLIFVASNALMSDPEYFNQPDKFIPERWLRDPQTNKKEKVIPFSYLPFGFGPRMCIGRRVVDLEMETTITKIIRNFHVEFNRDASKPFKAFFFMEPAISFPFKFTDVKD